MKTEAIVMNATGGPEVLTRAELDLPEPGPREVRLRIRAAGVNHLDLWVRRGLPNILYQFPHRLGADMAGEVEALGPGARGVSVGDRVVVSPGLSCGVCARCSSGEDHLCRQLRLFGETAPGGYGRHLNVPDTNLLACPESLSFTDAAAVPVTFMTAWQMVVRKAALKPGQTVLVQAAGSGVSSAAIQIAKLGGAHVIATASTENKLTRARALGADAVINYTTQDFVAETRRLTGRMGVDAVIEHVGGEVFTKSLLAARWGGRVVTCGATAGHTPSIDLRHVFFRQLEVLGSTLAPKGDLFTVLALVGEGRLRPVVDRVLPLWEAARAHELLERREVFGKIVLEVD